MHSLLITIKGLSSNHGEVYWIQHYVIKIVSDLRQVGGFLRVLLISSTNKTDHHDIAKIVWKVALNTTTITQSLSSYPDLYVKINLR